MDGAAFDVAFAQAQFIDHQKTLQLLEYEIGSGQESGLLRAYAAESLPMIREHLRMAQSVALGAAPYLPQAAAAPPSPTSPPATAPPLGGPTSGPGRRAANTAGRAEPVIAEARLERHADGVKRSFTRAGASARWRKTGNDPRGQTQSCASDGSTRRW
jgi:uncharacterized protein DUF4142